MTRSITISQWTQWESVLAGNMLSISCNLRTHTISWENCQWHCHSLHEILLSYRIWEAEGSLERENKWVKKWERTRIELLRWRQTKKEREKVAELVDDYYMKTVSKVLIWTNSVNPLRMWMRGFGHFLKNIPRLNLDSGLSLNLE